MRSEHNCGGCERGWADDNGRIHCGAAVDDAALASKDPSERAATNPIWAVRKYGMAGLFAMMSGRAVKGGDCEDMDPSDGAECTQWKAAE